MVTVQSLRSPRTFYDRTRVHNLDLRVKDLRKEIAVLEGNAEKARQFGMVHQAVGLEKRIPALRQQLADAEQQYNTAATEEAKRQHDEAMEDEHARELEQFYAEESAKEQERFEAWRKRRRGR